MTPDEIARILEAAYRHQRPWSAKDIAETLESPGARLFAREGGVLIARLSEGEAEILALATRPGEQRRGIARRLIEDLHKTASRAGCERIFLEVADTNAPARAFYDSEGYREAGRRRGYYRQADGSRDDALILSLSLSAS
ncbi:GNAT family N-acetyltransferase [Roseivivax sp. THAF30]|uniref:GNAT family N-acetyltransferase n=1 Tax=Roseivivax sp. THAF30 TaxID=2587852 RepID=UPI00126968A1|nr:GNAT family N-acetyltransferase [Roseivivax sp. THAF30]QFT64178.1 ribosomal-protein-alanine N-acetyltransferase [Roseivivax sp. THAF30]